MGNLEGGVNMDFIIRHRGDIAMYVACGNVFIIMHKCIFH
jgi:hypothetical protein